jgi:homoserine dehydrogenase
VLLVERQERGRMIAECADLGSVFDVPAYLDALPQEGVAVLVECLPTNPEDGQPALDFLRRALDRGIGVVTVDKGPMVHGQRALVELARERGVGIAYTGTTGVRPPPGLAGCHVLEIRGILNGTTNYVLTEMLERGLTFSRALSQAQEQGIAEPNPALDVQGWDTSCKLLILANEWMHAGASLADILRSGIGRETEELVAAARASGQAVRLIGKARRGEGRVILSVAPKLVGPDSPFHAIAGTSKGAVFRTREKGEVFAGGVSGRDAIAEVILQDIRNVTRAEGGPPFSNRAE